VCSFPTGKACTGGVCDGSGTCMCNTCACATASVSFNAQIEQPIFEAICKTCHRFGAGSLTFGTGADASWKALVNMPVMECADGLDYVAPNSPETSYLIDKLMGTNLCPGTTACRSAVPSSARLIQTITSWICEERAEQLGCGRPARRVDLGGREQRFFDYLAKGTTKAGAS
jgi:hypothetical protein